MGICFSSNASRSSEASLAALRIRLSTELGRTEGTDFSLFPSRPSPFDNASPRRVEPLAKTNNARSGKTRRIKNMAKCGRSYVPISTMPQPQCTVAPVQRRGHQNYVAIFICWTRRSMVVFFWYFPLDSSINNSRRLLSRI